MKRALGNVAEGAEDYDEWTQEEREEYGVQTLLETGFARACREEVLQAYVSIESLRSRISSSCRHFAYHEALVKL